MADQKSKSLMHNLGQFFGHVAKGVKTPAKPAAPAHTHEVRREVEERQEIGPAGEKITLRRTTIEEVEIQPPRPPNNPEQGDQP
jgi:hypothetical protein